MKKSYRVVIIVLAAVLLVTAIVLLIVSIAGKSDNGTTTSEPPTVTLSVPDSEPADSTVTTDPATTATPNSSELLIGKWMDSSDLSGFEFFADGTVAVTYVNLTLPVVDVPINGTYKGVYSVAGNTVKTVFSIYSATISDSYTFSVDGTALTLTNVEDGKTSMYMKTTSTSTPVQSTTAASSESESLAGEVVGTWSSSDGTVKLTLAADSAFTAVYTNASGTTLSSASPISGTYSGVYMVDSGSITMQYASSDAPAEKYVCSVSKNTMTLSKANVTRVMTRDGTAYVPPANDESELLGKWMDGAKMSGFEFKENGVVTVTYVNMTVPVINLPINGTYDGSYTIDGTNLSMSYSIYGSTIRKSYTYALDGQSLVLTDHEDMKTSTYMKQN